MFRFFSIKSQLFTVKIVMSKHLIAKPIIKKTLKNLKEKRAALEIRGLNPKMSVILVGDNQASLSYIKNKKRMCQKIGADFNLIELDKDISEDEFLKSINEQNNDESVTGCFVQLPIPNHLGHLDTATLVSPEKDVDGFHSKTSISLYRNQECNLIPCTPKGIVKMLKFYDIPIEGQDITIIGRSFIVGRPLNLLLSNLNATVTLCHSKSKNIKDHCKRADIIISAVGNPKYLDKSYISTTKAQTLIDVGINRDINGELCGDMDFENLDGIVDAITPVPGSVGPMTVLSLMENLIKATDGILNRRKK
jgi:methylenetetrahydrofolate dehydrogenase (NADP+)/methenyltetrahydrofolate cyclohydrolase